MIAVLSSGAIAHGVRLYLQLEASMAGRPFFEVEVSVDETESPTKNAQHVYIAHELRHLGVRWVSLAPRYISAFEKGVDLYRRRFELRSRPLHNSEFVRPPQ